MEIIRKITDELAIAGQISSKQIEQAVWEGYQSILNLRLSNEQGIWADEQQSVEDLGLHYLSLPVTADLMTDETVAEVFSQINQLPKPVLVHCDNGVRAAAIVLMYIAVRQGATVKQAFQQVEQFGCLEQ